MFLVTFLIGLDYSALSFVYLTPVGQKANQYSLATTAISQINNASTLSEQDVNFPRPRARARSVIVI